MAFKYAVALTGGIATGKSTVASYFTSFGFNVIDADSIAHTILDQQNQTIATLFGKNLVKDDRVDRKALGKIIFADNIKKKELEALLHPLIFNEIERLAILEDKKKIPYLVDIPLFFESNRYDAIEKILVVYATKEKQLKRVLKRDGFSKEDAQKRISSQINIEEKKQKATYVIENNNDLKQLHKECEKIKEKIREDFQ